MAAGGNGTAMIWDAATGNQIRVLQGHTDLIISAVFSPDRRTCSRPGTEMTSRLRLWEVETGRQIYSVPGGPGYRTLFFFPGGQTFYAGDFVYNTSDGQISQERVFGGSLAISPDGRTAVSGYSPTAKLYDVRSGQQIRAFSGHTDSVVTAAFSNDGKWLVTGSRDNTARVWEVASGKSVLLTGHTSMVGSVAISPNGSRILTGSNTARLWRLTAENQPQQIIYAPAGVTTFALAPDGKTILAGDVDGNTGLWDLSTGQQLLNFPKSDADVKSVAYSPDGKLIAVPECCRPNTGVLNLYDPATGDLLKTFTNDSNQPYIGTLTFSSDSKMIFAAYLDATSRLWNIDSGQVLRLFNGNDAENHGAAAYSPEGNLVTLADGRNWWDIATGLELDLPDEMTRGRTVFSDDGSLVAMPQYDLSVCCVECSRPNARQSFYWPQRPGNRFGHIAG